MAEMPRMEENVTAKPLGGGRYECEVSFSMEGTWQIWVSVEPKEGKKVRFKSSLNI